MNGGRMNDRMPLFGAVLVAALVTTSAIPLGYPPDKEPPAPGVAARRAVTQPLDITESARPETGRLEANVWYVGHQHNQVLL
jgi:hypothetical protein